MKAFFVFLWLFTLLAAESDIVSQYCEIFRDFSVYKDLQLDNKQKCNTNVLTIGKELCLADPLDFDKPLDYTCRTRGEILNRNVDFDSLVTEITMHAEPVPMLSIATTQATTSFYSITLPSTVTITERTTFKTQLAIEDLQIVPSTMANSSYLSTQLVGPHRETNVATTVSPVSHFSWTPTTLPCDDVCCGRLFYGKHVQLAQELRRLQFKVQHLNEQLFMSEVQTHRNEKKTIACQTTNTTCICSNITSDSDFFEMLYRQKVGFLCGSALTIFLLLLDQITAIYISKKKNIKQRIFTRLIFPTLICLIQLYLRRNNRQSNLADLLSALKHPSDSDNELDENGQCMQCRSLNRTLRPIPFSNRNLRQSRFGNSTTIELQTPVVKNFPNRTIVQRF